MGICNAPATFQSSMNSIFADYLDVFLVVYLADLLKLSESKEDHLKHLQLVLSRLRENHLFVGKNKCSLMKEETEFSDL